jgi:arylsulfatase A-like enzyme
MFVPPGAEPIDVTHYDQGGRSKVTRNVSSAQLAYVIAQYDGEIRWTDDTFGRVFERMKELDLWDETVIIVTSDHGEEFFEHGKKGHKNNLYVESVRVPLIIKPAGKTRPFRDGRPVSLVDVYPTVLDIAGVGEGRPPHHGHSLLEPYSGAPIYFELNTSWSMRARTKGEKWREVKRWLALREGQLKAIDMKTVETHPGREKRSLHQLFDVVRDPRETTPLGAEYADTLSAMLQRLAEWDENTRELGRVLGERGQADLSPAEIQRLRAIGYLD